jgi:molecular chaperone HtpG
MESQPIPFKAETRQLLNILIHSLYTEREIFLRELISNAADALTRLNFETLTNRDVHSPDAPLEIRITADSSTNTLTITDSGIGMTAEELAENLGTIAHSGARAFVEAARAGANGSPTHLSDVIGQFGVGFYSAFMAAESIRVVSRSYRKEASAAEWWCDGSDSFVVRPAQREARGTDVIIQLKEDAKEFAQEYRLREIIKKHSDFIPYPIFLGSAKDQTNRQSALWRQQPRQVEAKDYEEFYRQLTLDWEAPLAHMHLNVDAPVQMYALLYLPAKAERSPLSVRKEDGLKLYARKVLIQEYSRDLLPEYLSFVQGVVDSEDLPLNVSRESVQANRVMANLKKLVTNKVIDTLKDMAANDAPKYVEFWQSFGRYLRQGAAVEQQEWERLLPLLRFRSLEKPGEWVSLNDYLASMKPGQERIYYLLGDDERSLRYSPHLDLVRPYGYEVLLMADPIDPFVLSRLREYEGRQLSNLASPDLQIEPPAGEKDAAADKGKEKEGDTQDETPETSEKSELALRIQAQLGERVAEVRLNSRLSSAPARLVDAQGALNPELQRVYRLLDREFEAPKKVLEINPAHAILQRIAALPQDDPLAQAAIEQVYENALLIEGLHPDPAGMIPRLQQLIEAALGKQE